MKVLALFLLWLSSSQACIAHGKCDTLVLTSNPDRQFGYNYADAWGKYTLANTTGNRLMYVNEFGDYYISSDFFVSFFDTYV